MDVPIRVLVVDSHVMTLWGLSRLLDKNQFIVLPEYVVSLAQAQAVCKQDQPGILLLAGQLAKPFLAASLAPFRQRHPSLSIILLDEGTPPLDLPSLGVVGYLCREDALETWGRCFRAVVGGHIFFSRRVQNGITGDQATQIDLSEREVALLKLLMQGYRIQEIAVRLNLSSATVRNNLTYLYNKLGVKSRSEAQAWS